MIDRDDLALECQLRFIDLATEKDPTAVPERIDLFIDGFWEGVRAAAKPRSADELRTLLELRRARAAALIK